MFEIKDLSARRGDQLIFNHVGFGIKSGELGHIKGCNGSGKTTLLRILAGLFEPEHGEVLWNDQSISQLGDQYRADVLYVGHLNAIKDDLTALENLSVAASLFGLSASEDQLFDCLDQMGLADKADTLVKQMSQGQKRRVALTKMLFSTAKIWLLDEPFVALDVVTIEKMRDIFCAHLSKRGIIMLTTHQDVLFPDVNIKQLELST